MALIPTDQIDGLIKTINEVQSPADLQAAVDDAAESIKPVKDAIVLQMAKMSPWLALLSPPTTPTAVITWLKTFIEGYLTAQLGPAIVYPVQMAALTAKVAELTSAISSAQSRLNCSITIPPLV